MDLDIFFIIHQLNTYLPVEDPTFHIFYCENLKLQRQQSPLIHLSMVNRSVVIALLLACIASIALSAPAGIEEGVRAFSNDSPSEPFSIKKFVDDLETTSRASTTVETEYDEYVGRHVGVSDPFNRDESEIIWTKFTCPKNRPIKACNCGFVLDFCAELLGSIFGDRGSSCFCWWRSYKKCEKSRSYAHLLC